MAATAGYVFILWNGNGLFLSDYPSRNHRSQIGWESDCAGYCLPEMPADYILCILAAIMARRLPDGTGVSVEKNE